MRKLNQANHLTRPIGLLLITLFGTLITLTAQIPEDSLVADTALAEQYIQQADLSSDSTTYYYKKALAIYTAAKGATSDSIIWQRYLAVNHLLLYTLKDREKAIKLFPNIRQEAIQKFGSQSLAVAENHYYLARRLSAAKQHDAAKAHFQLATETYEAIKDTAGVIKATFLHGNLCKHLLEFDRGLGYLQTALDKSLQFYGAEHQTTTDIYYKKGQLFFNQGNYQQALKVLDTLMPIESALHPPNSPKLATTFIMVGNIHFKATNYDEAIQYYEKSKAIYVQDSSKNIKNLASCIGNIGAANIEKGNFAKANELYIQAAELKKSKYGENSISLAYTYYNIGSGYAQQGDFQPALDYLFKSVRIIRKSSGEQHPDVAYVYNGIGGIYSQTGEWEKAMDYYQKALDIRTFTQTTDHPETANDYDRIGIVQQKNGDFSAAQTSFEKGLVIRQKVLNSDHRAIADSYLHLATIHRHDKDFSTAESLLKKSLAIKEKQLNAYHPSIANTYLELAKIAKSKNDLAQALAYYQTAMVRLVPDFEAMNIAKNPTIEANFSYKTDLVNLLYQKGATLKKQYLQQSNQSELLDQSYQTLKAGSELADLIRQEYQSDFSKKALLKNAFVVYKELVEVGAILANVANAKVSDKALFSLMEKSKSILLLENIKDESAKTFAGVSTASLQLESDLKKQIAFFENQLTRKKEAGAESSNNRVMELEEKLFHLRQESQALVQQLEKENPKYHQLKYSNQLAGIEDIQQTLVDEESALLQYTLTDKQLYVMAITKYGVEKYQQTIDTTFHQQLASVKQFLNTNPVSQTKNKQQIARQQFIQQAFKLQQQLLAPILAKIPSVEHLVIIPDGTLNYLPFEALITTLPKNQNATFDQLNFVLHQHAIYYEYSATLWWQNMQAKQATNQVFAGFAPAYQGSQLLAARGSEAIPTAFNFSKPSPTFAPLQFNQSEVNLLADALNGEILLGEAATESAFKKEASKYGVLHLAMHAYVNDKNPNYSHLVFAAEKDTTEDRFLYAYELYNMQLKAEMAVLSACETGGGQLQQGEGVMSLSRAFKYAGVPNIVMSFWKADDFYTKNIMTQFYQYLKTGTNKNKALQQAKIAQIASAKDNKEAAHPFYWANFVLVGNEKSMQFRQPQGLGWLVSGMLLLMTLVSIKKKKLHT